MSEVIIALEGPIAPMVCASDDPTSRRAVRTHRLLQRRRSSGCRVRDAVVRRARFDDPRRARRAARSVIQPIHRRPCWPSDRCPAPAQGVHRTTMNSETATLPGTRTAPEPPAQRRSTTACWSSATCTWCPSPDPTHEILRGIDLEIRKGEVHAIMGRNGSGKTTLAYALMGHPGYTVTSGEVIWKGLDMLALSADKRARLGLFLAFQYPTAVPGLSVASFLRTALNARRRGLDASQSEIDPVRPDPRRHQDGRVPQPHAREDGAAQAGRLVRRPLRQRGLLRWREEAPGDAPDGHPGARVRGPR